MFTWIVPKPGDIALCGCKQSLTGFTDCRHFKTTCWQLIVITWLHYIAYCMQCWLFLLCVLYLLYNYTGGGPLFVNVVTTLTGGNAGGETHCTTAHTFRIVVCLAIVIVIMVVAVLALDGFLCLFSRVAINWWDPYCSLRLRRCPLCSTSETCSFANLNQ